jgi:RNA polymerase sigma-70 factor, ECF subfamily
VVLQIVKTDRLPYNQDHIISGCLRADRKSQELLYTSMYPVMIKICHRYCTDLQEAGSLYNEGMLKVFGKISQYGHEGSFEGWIKRIMVNTCIDHCRRQVKFQTKPLEHTDSESWSVSPEVYGRINAGDIMMLVRELPKNTGLVFNLHVIEGYKHHEIAELVGITAGTSKWHLNEARKLLKQKLENLSNQQLYLHAS